MKGGTIQIGRIVIACIWFLAFSRSAKSVSFLHHGGRGSSSTLVRHPQHHGRMTSSATTSTTTTSSSSSRTSTRTRTTTRPTAMSSSSSSSSSNTNNSHNHNGASRGGTGNHHHSVSNEGRRRNPLWRVFSSRGRSSSSSPLKAKPNGTMFPSLSSLATTLGTGSSSSSSTATPSLTLPKDEQQEQQQEQENQGMATTTTTTTRRRRVHVASVEEDQQQQNNNNNNNGSKKEDETEPPPAKNQKSSKSNLKIHTYVDRRGRTWKALNTPRDKFEAFLRYHKVWNNNNDNGNNHKSPRSDKDRATMITTVETTTQVDAATAQSRREEWRKLWKQGHLLTERTEYLAVYPSDNERLGKGNGKQNGILNKNASVLTKRGGFSDLLHLYTQRLLSFLRDEQEDQHHAMIRWLQKEYGRAETARLTHLAEYPPSEQKAYWKEFLEWFRERFPYYYDRCSHCGASVREDVANNVISDDSHQNGKGHKTFLGYIYPEASELTGKASRTELYQCHKCHAYTRFPRYNSAWHVIEHRRGRCGEYSMLLFRLLRALGHETRWVVDWADHVWVEVFCERAGTWIHLDPCEAAVDENFLYQGWGKKQTYVLAFYAPPPARGTKHGSSSLSASSMKHSLIEDVTASYTTDTADEIQSRRDERERHVQQALQQSTEYLRQRLISGVYED